MELGHLSVAEIVRQLFDTRHAGDRALVHSLRHRIGQIVLLANILLQVVEMNAAVLIPFNQFVIAFANRASGNATLIAVVWVVPIKRFSVECFSFERRTDVDAVNGMLYLHTRCSPPEWGTDQWSKLVQMTSAPALVTPG